MNIFVMILVFLFMAGYYLTQAPSQNVPGHSIEQALEKSDIGAVAECTAHAHELALRNQNMPPNENMDCIKKFNISNQTICVSDKGSVIDCSVTSKMKSPSVTFAVTSAMQLGTLKTSEMLDFLGKNYPNTSNFGIFISGTDGNYILSANSPKREIPYVIVKSTKLETGQLVYITQYATREETKVSTPKVTNAIICPSDNIKVMRYGRPQCIPKNDKIVCTGDTIWDNDTSTCVIDPRRRPLCSNKQTPVQIDDYWFCADPINEKTCSKGMVARLNYSTFDWECIPDPSTTKTNQKCENAGKRGVYGAAGATVRIEVTSCTDCEKMITDQDTCESYCVPDADKLDNLTCYPSNNSCSGSNRAFYFGFPASDVYATQAVSEIPALATQAIPVDRQHAQNRKFNCLDCGTGEIDTDASLYPYIAVCK